MKRAGLLMVVAFSLPGLPGWSQAAFSSLQKVKVSATASVGGSSSQAPLTITAPVLPANAFFGKDAVIPVEVVAQGATISTQGLRVEIGYQLVDVSNRPIGTLTRAPVHLVRDPRRGNALIGNATIPKSDLVGIERGGTLQYYFRAEQNTGDTVLSAGGISQAPPGTSA